MRQVVLDPHETDVPDSEQFVGISTASKTEYKKLEDFILVSGNHFPFNKIDSPTRNVPCSHNDLSAFIVSIISAYPQELIPQPVLGGFIYADDWNYKDYAYETENTFVRVVWTTTA